MGKTEDCIKFTYDKLHKSWRKGKTPPLDICVLETIKSYLDRTEAWRGEDQSKSQLLLSFIAPHNPVSSSTIANWIKKMLQLCNVNSTFTAHSTRSASTSKADFAGLSEKEILKRASWNCQSTWQNHYRKNIDSDLTLAKKFQSKLFEK